MALKRLNLLSLYYYLKKYGLIAKGTLSINLRLCALSVKDICKVCLTKHYAMKAHGEMVV
jgi:hypothetical protein